MSVIATWNVENLFRPGSADGPSDQRAYAAKLAALAQVIRAMAPDVLALQEVGDPAALADLATEAGGSWHSELSPFGDDRGIAVAFLSRLPIERVDQIRPFPPQLAPVQLDDQHTTTDQMGRGALHIHVVADGRPIDLVTCHLKSKLLTFPGGRFSPRDEGERARFAVYALNRRGAEAATVRAYADRLLDGDGQDRSVIVLGDLNDEPQAATTQILHGPPGSEIDTPGFDRPDTGDGRRLINLAPLIPPEQRYSRVFRGRRELIDHIFTSHQLAHQPVQLGTGRGHAPSITEFPRERRAAPGSDHLPVVARFDQ